MILGDVRFNHEDLQSITSSMWHFCYGNNLTMNVVFVLRYYIAQCPNSCIETLQVLRARGGQGWHHPQLYLLVFSETLSRGQAVAGPAQHRVQKRKRPRGSGPGQPL